MPFLQCRQVNFPRIVSFIIFSLIFGVALLFAIVKLSGSGEIQFKLGDDVFEVGDAQLFADRIESDRSPIPFSSLSGARPIYVQHTGGDPAKNWFAIDARSPSDPVNCALNWDIERQVFVDGCDESSLYPVDGNGLTRFRVAITEFGILVIDLNQIYAPTSD